MIEKQSITCPRCGALIPNSQITAIERPNGEWTFFGKCDCSEDVQSSTPKVIK